MNKKQILQQLHDTANQLEKKGLYAEANVLTNVMTRVAQQAPQQNQLRYKLSDQFHKIFMEIFDNFKKISPIMNEINRKRDSGAPLQQSQNSFQSIVMCNNILNQNKTLQTQLQNVFNQLQKLMNPNESDDQYIISSYQKSLNSSQNAIYEWSEIVNQYNTKMKQYQPNQTQQPNQAQQPVQTPK